MASVTSASSKVSAEQPGLGKGSAAQPESEKHLPLSELNKASAKTGGSSVVDAFSSPPGSAEQPANGVQPAQYMITDEAQTSTVDQPCESQARGSQHLFVASEELDLLRSQGGAAQPALPGSSEVPAQHAQLPAESLPPDDSAAQPVPNPEDFEMASVSEAIPWLATLQGAQSIEIASLTGVAAWLAALPAGAVSRSPPLKRLSLAVSILQTQPSRQKRAQLQKLFFSWDVGQFSKRDGKRKLDDAVQRLETKVVHEAKRLKLLCRSSASSSLPFSAIHLHLQR